MRIRLWATALLVCLAGAACGTSSAGAQGGLQPSAHGAASARKSAPHSPATAVGVHLESSDSARRAYQLAVLWQGIERSWWIVEPQPALPRRSRSLLIVLHGAGSNGASMRHVGFEALGGDMMIAYPDAVDGTWNDGREGVESRAHRESIDDVGFLAAIIDDARQRFDVDPSSVFIAGFSNGGIMAARLACGAAFAIRGVALVSASAPSSLPSECQREAGIATIVIHGNADGVIPEAGGPVARRAGANRGAVMGLRAYYELLRTRSNCMDSSIESIGNVDRWSATNCAGGPAPVIYRVRGAGHSWFRPPQFSTTDTVWRFFSEQ